MSVEGNETEDLSEQEDMDDYYGGDCDLEETNGSSDDPEDYALECLTIDKTRALFDDLINSVRGQLNISPHLTKYLLYKCKWDMNQVITKYSENAEKFLLEHNVKCEIDSKSGITDKAEESFFICEICTMPITCSSDTLMLECRHSFCKICWISYLEVKIMEGSSLDILCMAQKCKVVVLEDFVLKLPLRLPLLNQYQKFAFQEYVKANPYLRFCPGPNCNVIFKAKEIFSKRASCPQCSSTFCFLCGYFYHAPSDCETMKKWLKKCADDSETANYISANTKDCPQCSICIEKNGGCNHMQCCKCRFEFCWICLGDWKAHGSEYYECSRYKDKNEAFSEAAKARSALKKYLHYYERWQNHAKSLQFEEILLQKIKKRINQKVMNSSGTWIDWQYLLNAASLLAKCRYTLQYTYPYAYYLTQEKRKDLFEYQQAQLEAEIENLSWKVERAETTDRGELENQMYIAEKRRITLLKDFFQSSVWDASSSS